MAIAVAAVPLSSHAQGATRRIEPGTPYSYTDAARLQLGKLFQGIALSDSVRLQADAILQKATIDLTTAGRTGSRSAMDSVVTRRDSTLRALLTSDDDRKKFDANVARLNPPTPPSR